MNDENGTLMLGVERDLLEEFFVLLRDKWQLADKANYFLEQYTGVGDVGIAITNQRDAISHFVTFLSNPNDTTREKRQAQLYGAEEHLRRAIIESYQYTALSSLKNALGKAEEYKKAVLTLIDPEKLGAPTLKELNQRFTEIHDLCIKGDRQRAGTTGVKNGRKV